MMKLIIAAFLLLPLPGLSQNLQAPENLQGEFDSLNRTIKLFWQPSTSKVAGYNLFVRKGDDSKFLLWGKAGIISATNYQFEVVDRAGESYEFKVCSVQNFPQVIRSDYSNSILIEVPSTFLPMVRLLEPKIKKTTAELTWHYEVEAPDLDGFIIYFNKEEIKVDNGARKHTFHDLESGKYIVKVVAVAKSGLTSTPSAKKIIVIK